MTYKTQAIVLKSYPWPRHARYFVLYTRDHGKVRAAAQGIGKITSKVAGHLQPFTIADVMLVTGRSTGKIAQANVINRYPAVTSDWEMYTLACYVLEIVDKFTQESVRDSRVWEELLATLEEFSQRGQWQGLEDSLLIQLHLLARVFALRMMDRLGFRPQLHQCVVCSSVVGAQTFPFSLLQGGLVCEACASHLRDTVVLPVEAVKFLRYILTKPFEQAVKLVVPNTMAISLMDIIDQYVCLQLNYPLHSLKFLHLKTDFFYA